MARFDISSINRRIRNIKDKGLQPITLKSDADMYARIVSERGTSTEGEILTYNEAYKQYQNYLASRRKKGIEITEDFNEQTYNEIFEEFVNLLGEKTYLKKTYKDAYDIAKKGVIPEIKKRSPELYKRFMSLSIKDRVLFLRDFGTDLNDVSETDQYKYGEIYLDLLAQWLDNYGV